MKKPLDFERQKGYYTKAVADERGKPLPKQSKTNFKKMKKVVDKAKTKW